MSANEYHFVSHWRVEGTVKEVSEVLSRATDLPRWWPDVYLSVKEIQPAGVFEMHTKGWLPYTLRWFFRVTESNLPSGFSLEAWGDLEGRGVWSFVQNGKWADITYDWRIRAEKPVLRYLSFVLKPIFEANHRWAMARGEESLCAELGRRAGAGQQPAPQTS